MVVGAVIVIVGLVILLDNLGIVQVHDMWRFWPLIMIGIGVAKVMERRGPAAQVWGGLVAVIGIAFLLDNLHIRFFYFDVSDIIWPVAIIGFGVFLLLKAMDRRKSTGDIAPDVHGHDTNLGAWAIFSSVKRKVDAQDFKGGEAMAIFGEVKVDLRKAGLAGDRAVIDVNALFGGVDIRVPENWSVVMKGTGDLRRVRRQIASSAPGARRQSAATDHHRHGRVRRHQSR